ncbi:MAG: hypothetical protein Q9201_002164 [Fulgogasparrea decipioides]
MLGRIGRQLGMLEAYSRLYSKSDRLESSLLASYEAYLSFSVKCKALLSEAQSKRSAWHQSSTLTTIAKGLWKPVKREFESTISRLEQAVDDFTDEADLAEKEAASLARTNATAQARFEEHRTLFEWLDPVDPHVNYQKAVSLHEPHTGQWIFSSPELEAWFSANNGVLWLHAKPGAGKTIMASTMITDKKIYDSLQSVPKGLDETYIRILARIRQGNSGDIETIKRMFFWLTHSLKPLTIVELADAITLHPGQKTMDFSAVATEPLDLLQFSGGLITTMEDGKTVCLAHFSIKEFFLSHRIESTVSEFYADNTKLQVKMTKICLNYLMMNDFATGQCHSIKQVESRLDAYPFLRYVAVHWVKNYQSLPNSVLTWQQIEKHVHNELLGRHHRATGKWEHNNVKVAIMNAWSPMYNAAHYSLAGLVEPLCQMRCNVNERGGQYHYPLLAAARHKKHGPAIITILIAMNADINVRNYRGNVAQNGIVQASEHWDLLKDLVRHGLELRGGSNRGMGSIIGVIAEHPSDAFQMVEFLLDNGADMDDLLNYPNYPDDNEGYTHFEGTGPPLQLACRNDNLKVTELLLRRGARRNYIGADPFKGNFCAALLATKKSNIQLLQELVDTKPFDHTIGSALVDALSLCQDDATSQLLINIINNKPFQPIQEDFAALL